MLLTICIALLILAIFDKPVDKILGRLKGISWKEAISDSWNNIVRFSKRAGRDVTRTALLFFYTLKDGELTITEKALLYAGIAYVIIPNDLLPRRVLGMLGIVDDVAISAWIYNKIQQHITPTIIQQTEDVLTSWFGTEVVIGPAPTR